MGEYVEAKDIFIAFSVDQGLNVVNAIHSLNVPVVLCYAHRFNTVFQELNAERSRVYELIRRNDTR